MRSEREANGDPDLISHVVLLIGILEFFAAPASHPRNQPLFASLEQKRKLLQDLVDSHAQVAEVRAQALGAITLAEQAIQQQLRDSVRSVAQSKARGLAGLRSRLKGKRVTGSADADDHAAEALDIMRRSGARLLEKLAQLRGELAVSGPAATADPPTPSRPAHRRAVRAAARAVHI